MMTESRAVSRTVDTPESYGGRECAHRCSAVQCRSASCKKIALGSLAIGPVAVLFASLIFLPWAQRFKPEQRAGFMFAAYFCGVMRPKCGLRIRPASPA